MVPGAWGHTHPTAHAHTSESSPLSRQSPKGEVGRIPYSVFL